MEENGKVLSHKLVGELKCLNTFPFLVNICAAEGLNKNMVKYLGGMWVLFNTKNEEEREKIKSNLEIQGCLKSIKKWDENFQIKDRIVLLKIEGLPPQARGPNNFIKIGRLWGDVIITDTCSESRTDWSFGKICVRTDCIDFIKESVEVIIGTDHIRIRVTELEGDRTEFQDEVNGGNKSENELEDYPSSDSGGQFSSTAEDEGSDEYSDDDVEGSCPDFVFQEIRNQKNLLPATHDKEHAKDIGIIEEKNDATQNSPHPLEDEVESGTFLYGLIDIRSLRKKRGDGDYALKLSIDPLRKKASQLVFCKKGSKL
ncbi:hypothetical protein L2E82_03464 [Cichorium intybus]|uniref:Uncharacterized protein n=1 Tax=Cichorium intybus TaxID=13427 RepID=A0ACB9H3V7_CICIN|nr:hypothetical protein L2E82_03464 [Cichorium intybus]